MNRKNTIRRISSFAVAAMAALMLVVLVPGAVYASDNINYQYLKGKNVGYNDYTTANSPVYSHLVKTTNGYMRVQGNVESSIVAVYYDNSFKLLSRKTIPAELPIYGGFYESSDNYYLVTGHTNYDEDDSVEVFRITKYDKNWNRLGSASLYGANTYVPFDAGSCDMTMDGRFLFVRTCHTMYADEKGLHHQANVTIQIGTTSMEVTYSFTKVYNYLAGYVSHSFNQFIRTENNKIVAFDQGDASPRGLIVMNYDKDFSDGVFLNDPFTRVDFTRLYDIPGSGNYTGSSAGAFEISDSSYLVAGNSIFKNRSDEYAFDNYRTRNIFVASVDKDTKEVTMHWLTNKAEGETTATTPHMVKVQNNKYMVLWTEKNDVKYAFVDVSGNPIGSTYSLEGSLSDCVPLVDGNKVIWYTWKNAEETFYTIPVNDPSNPSVVTSNYDHDYEWIKTENGLASFKCRKCGGTTSGRVPTSFKVYWKYPEDQYYWANAGLLLEVSQPAGYYITGVEYSAESDSTYNEFVIETTDENGVVTSYTSTGKVQFSALGTYTVTVYPKYNPELKREFTFQVKNPLTSVMLQTDLSSPQAFGTPVTLTAEPDGGKDNIKYKFIVTDPAGTEIVLQNGYEESTTWDPPAAGTYSLRVEATDTFDDSVVTSEALAYTVSKADRPFVLPPAEIASANSFDTLTNDILAGSSGWEFSADDLGTPLNVGESATFTVYYTGEDKDNFSDLTAEVTVTRSACDHNGGYRTEGAIQATCVSTGWTGDKYCKLCGELVESGTETPADANNHVHISVIPGKAATTTAPGYTESRVCDDCGRVITPAYTIPQIDPSSGSQGSYDDWDSYDDWGYYEEIMDLPAVKITKPKAGKKSFTAKWKKISKKNKKKMQGIEIQYSTDGFQTIAGSRTVGKGKKSVKIKGLQPKTTYWVRVRAYREDYDALHVSPWKTKKVKVK